jgi:hypothetical protein
VLPHDYYRQFDAMKQNMHSTAVNLFDGALRLVLALVSVVVLGLELGKLLVVKMESGRVSAGWVVVELGHGFCPSYSPSFSPPSSPHSLFHSPFLPCYLTHLATVQQ